MPTDEIIETIEDEEIYPGFLKADRESFEFVDELIEDFDAAFEKRCKKSLRLKRPRNRRMPLDPEAEALLSKVLRAYFV